jgi:MinD-like ATPase involved in chromosome partitioning or flagellar assembly
VALDNKFIKDKLTEKYGEIVYSQDIVYMEGVIEFLTRTNEKYIVITRDNLDGNLTNKLYAKQLRLAKNDAKIIFIVEELKKEYKEFLFANEIFNIIEGESVSMNEILESIEQDKRVIYKFIDKKQDYKEDLLNNEKLNFPVQKELFSKQTIAIYGTSGAGKSFISSILSRNLCKKLNISVALLDMDIQNPSIDILNNIDCNINSLSKIIEDIDRNLDINKNIDTYVQKCKNKRLVYMTNNVSVFECQNKLSNKYYDRIYSSMKLTYDYNIIDLPSSPFFDVVPYTLINATKVFFVINPNYASIRQAVKYLDLLTKLWDVVNGKIYLIVNKCQKNSLDNEQIEAILRGYKIIANIEYNSDMDSYINGAQSEIDFNIDCTKIYEALGLSFKDKQNKKFNIIKSVILNKKELKRSYDNQSI